MAPNNANITALALQELLRTRQTTHDFFNEPVDDEIVMRALGCAIRAPNHFLNNPWRFTILGHDTRSRIARANAQLTEERYGADAAQAKYTRWMGVPGWLLVTSLRDEDATRAQENFAATCCATQNFCLALFAEGVGSKWTSGAVTRLPVFPELCDYDPLQEQFVGLIWYGWPRKVTPLTKRLPLQEVVRKLR